MENRKLIIVLLVGLFLILHQQAQAYHTDTHEYLTQEAVRLYNNQQQTDDSIGTQQVPFLMDGARREDDPPRWMNHFYDPVYERGLSEDLAIDPLYKLGNWASSKEWAQNSSNQKSLIYTPIIGSILSVFDRGKIEPILATSDFTWEQALKHYLQGDTEGALFALGHILHLIQDAAVPDHTRNDPHADGSPYEAYAKQFTIHNQDPLLRSRLNTIDTPINDSLDNYFVQIATYSNNNFYSKDTIGVQSGYNQPEPDYFQKEGKFYYGFKKVENKYIHLLAKTSPTTFVYFDSKNNITIDESDRSNKINSDYWSLLSTKAVAYSAGVIDLFFKEVAAHQNDPNYTTPEKQSLLGQIASFANNTITALTNSITTFLIKSPQNTGMQEIPLTTTSNIPSLSHVSNNQSPASPTPTPIPSPQKEYVPIIALETTQIKEPLIKTQTTTTTAPEKDLDEINTKEPTCITPTTKHPLQSSIIFNEVAWMGDTESANNEWVELKNPLTIPLSIYGWSMKNASGSITIRISEENIVPANGLVIFTRGTHMPSGDISYTGSLRNNDEELFLFDASCNLMDYISAQPTWPAGMSADRRTMERDATGLGWHTSSYINGTPRAQNSGAYYPPTTATIQTESPTHNSADSLLTLPLGTIRINEIMYNPIGTDTHHEWIELINTSSTPFDLTRYWKIHENNTNHTINEYHHGNELPAYGYAIIADDAETFIADYPETTAPIFDSIFSLNNTGETIALTFGEQFIDRVTYASSTGANGDGYSLQYVTTSDTWISATPTPGTLNLFSIDTTTPLEDLDTQDHPTSTPEEPEENATSTPPESEEHPFTPVGQHILMSEIYPDKNGTNEDFIELYNPTDDTIALADYKLKILKEDAVTITSLITFKDAELKDIAPHSYYLIGFDDYASSTLKNADVVRSASLPSSKSATIILIYISDELDEDILIDEITYNPDYLEKDQSFERKAWTNGYCASPFDDYEFGGNGCDEDVQNIMMVREHKNPQSTLSLTEPRPQPHAVSHINTEYHQDTMTMQVTWDDIHNEATGIYYTIDALWNNATTSTHIATTTSYEYTWRVYDINTDYLLSVYASDYDSYQSPVATTTITIPSFISGVDFYNPDAPTIDLYYDTYPFIPSVGLPCRGSMATAYLNSPPQLIQYISDVNIFDGNIPSINIPELFPFSYRNNRGFTTKKLLMIRDPADILDISLEDRFVHTTTTHIEMYPAIPMPELNENTYLTFAFYSCRWVNSLNNRTYEIIGIDHTPYYFSPSEPVVEETSLIMAPMMLTETTTEENGLTDSSDHLYLETSTTSTNTANSLPEIDTSYIEVIDGTIDTSTTSTNVTPLTETIYETTTPADTFNENTLKDEQTIPPDGEIIQPIESPTGTTTPASEDTTIPDDTT